MTSKPPKHQASDATREVLVQRARRLAQPHVSAGRHEADHLVRFEVAGRRYLVPSSRVREVLAPGRVSALPGGNHLLCGARTARGETVVVTDLSALDGHLGVKDQDACFVVVLDAAEPLGLLAEQVSTAERSGGPISSETGELSARVSDDGALIIDVDALIADPRLRSLAFDSTQSISTEGSL